MVSAEQYIRFCMECTYKESCKILNRDYKKPSPYSHQKSFSSDCAVQHNSQPKPVYCNLCNTCPVKDTCTLPQKKISVKEDFYYSISGKKVNILEARIKKFNNSYVVTPPDWEQLSFD